MCGIVCIARSEGEEAPGIDQALNALNNRGPDGTGQWTSQDKTVKLGHKRLSINDLSERGSQPMHNESKTISMVCNGEIYNAPALRLELEQLGHIFHSFSDNEVIIHSYEEWGKECISKFLGMFAFVLWDEPQRKIFAAKDHVGIKPLCYAHSNDGIAIASTFFGLLPMLPEKPNIDPLGIAYAMSYRVIPSPYSIWEDTYKLEPGHYLIWDEKNGLKISNYWSPPSKINYDGAYSLSDWKSLFSSVLNEHLLSDVPIGVFLSGGLDSSCITAGLKDLGIAPTLLSVSFPGDANDESRIAQMTARRLKMNIQTIPIILSDIDDIVDSLTKLYDEPETDNASIPMYLICKEASKYFKVVIAGDGGDECFGGYSWYRKKVSVLPPVANQVFRYLRRNYGWSANQHVNNMLSKFYSRTSFFQRYMWNVFQPFLPEEIEQILSPSGIKFDEETQLTPLIKHYRPDLPYMRSMQRIDLLTFCSEFINSKVDRASMGNSLEVRVPFLDRRIIEWGLRKPFQQKELNPKYAKSILRDYLKTYNLYEVLNAPKSGFSLKIMKKYDFNLALTQIKKSWLIKSGFLNRKWEHIVNNNKTRRKERIWCLFMLAKWCDYHLQ